MAELKSKNNGFYNIYVKNYNIIGQKKKDGSESKLVEIRIFPNEHEVYSFKVPAKFVNATKSAGTKSVGLLKTMKYDLSHSYKRDGKWDKAQTSESEAVKIVTIYNSTLKTKTKKEEAEVQKTNKKQVKLG